MRFSQLAFSTLILVGCATASHAQELVSDGGFEAAITGITTGSLGDGAWTTAQGAIDVFSGSTLANTGSKSVQLTNNTSANALTQSLATTTGQQYTLSFFVVSDTGADPFTVLFGGQTVTATPAPKTFPALGTANGTYIREAFVVTALSNNTALRFQATYGGGGSSYGTLLDDVSVRLFTPAVTPEPGSVAMMVGMGVTGAGFLVRRRKAARNAA